MKIVWRTATSMDGRIASAWESLDFLEAIEDAAATTADFPDFLRSIDSIIVGGATLRWLIRGGHGWPHGDIPTWLVSRDQTLERQVGLTAAPFRRIEGDPIGLIDAMEAEGRQRAWLAGGGNIAGQLLAIDRIDEVEATIAPVALGAGPSLFGEQPLALRQFELAEVKRLGGNAVMARWVRPAAS
ncbi:MAG: dihydrofolate reductase family protein [Devosia sp.]|nr:dihydrofolate reductase family protein [Devosia sp.]